MSIGISSAFPWFLNNGAEGLGDLMSAIFADFRGSTHRALMLRGIRLRVYARRIALPSVRPPQHGSAEFAPGGAVRDFAVFRASLGLRLCQLTVHERPVRLDQVRGDGSRRAIVCVGVLLLQVEGERMREPLDPIRALDPGLDSGCFLRHCIGRSQSAPRAIESNVRVGNCSPRREFIAGTWTTRRLLL